MFLFKIDKKLKPIKEQKIELEKDVQKLTEENLESIFGLKFVSTEFSLHGFRIDTLAFDKENNSFVIIEYKRDRSFSVIDQGYSYLSLMLNNKSDFILEYYRKVDKNLDDKNIDWSQSRVIFVANSFTSYQKNAINFKDLPIELWEFNKYDDNLVSYNPIIAINAVESIKTITKSNAIINKVTEEVKQYSIEDHFKDDWKKTRELFYETRDRILELDHRIEEKSNKHYISYSLNGKNMLEIGIQSSGLRIHLDIKQKELRDFENKTRDVENIGHHGTGSAEVRIDNKSDIDYVFSLIKQVYDKFIK